MWVDGSLSRRIYRTTCRTSEFSSLGSVVSSMLKHFYRRVDWLGAFLVTAGLIFVVFILSDGPNAPDGWKTGCKWFALLPNITLAFS